MATRRTIDHDNYEDSEQYYIDRDARWVAEDAVEQADRQTDAGRLARMEHRLYVMDTAEGRIMRAGEIDQLRAETEALRAKIKAEDAARFAAEWTREVTEARRAEWNSRAKAGEFRRNGKIHWATVRTIERTVLGWSNEDLQRAIKMHGL